MPIGYWESEHLLAPADFTVIGGGIVGMSAALHFKAAHPQARVRLVERDVLGEGGTTRNAGFACFGGAGEWLDDLEALGAQRWLALIRMRAEGLRTLIELLGASALGLEWSGAWELFPAPGPGGNKESRVLDAIPELNRLAQPVLSSILNEVHPAAADTPALALAPERAHDFGAHSAVHLCWEGMLHTGKMVSAFHKALRAADIQCLHGCTVQALNPREGSKGWALDTLRGELFSEKVAICTNGFARAILPDLAVKPAPNRVLVATPQTMPPAGAYHIEDGYLYFRTLPGGQVLFGGGRHYGIDLPHYPACDAKATAQWDQRLTADAERWLGPIDAITHRWTGWLGVGSDREPIIGSTAPGLHHAVRMGGMGVAIGCGVGKALAEAIGAPSA